jgi:hypothetical protein
LCLREPLKIHFGGQANLFVSGLRQAKAALSTNKADLGSLPEDKNFLLAAQKQLLELPYSLISPVLSQKHTPENEAQDRKKSFSNQAVNETPASKVQSTLSFK